MKTIKIIGIGIAAGIVASFLKSKSEGPLQDIGLKYFPAADEELRLKGADIQHHPENMPPAILVKRLFKNFSGEVLKDSVAVRTMPYIHYTLGTFMGMAYVFARSKDKKVSIMQGIPAGAVMFGLTHGSVVPALNLQEKVRKMPKSWWVWEFGSHLLFGFFLEQSTKILKNFKK